MEISLGYMPGNEVDSYGGGIFHTHIGCIHYPTFIFTLQYNTRAYQVAQTSSKTNATTVYCYIQLQKDTVYILKSEDVTLTH